MRGKDSEPTRGTPGPDERARSIAEQLLALPLGERSEALARHCGDDTALEADVLRALDQAVGGTGFLKPPGVGERVRRMYGANVDPKIDLDEHEPKPTSAKLIESLSSAPDGGGRYELRGEIARGGMGAILEVFDHDLRRSLAMKVILTHEERAEDETPLDPMTLGRFLEEAQITGQLDHPGIVPVHELGLDDDGRVYFTMKLVKGRTLAEIYELVEKGAEGWSRERALGVLQRVCEAMAYAHAKGVIHRDLKPANVMVGRFGEVCVMDWGVARVLGREDSRDLRLRDVSATRSLSTVRRDESGELDDSPLITMDGTVVGTPSYMSPEQARGEVEKLDRRSDVYSVGAMLYQLLTGQMPYAPAGARVSPYTVLMAVMQGPPPAPSEVGENIPPALEAICLKAMGRAQDERYSDTEELAEDLRAYLENRVVQAYRTGPIVEATAWIRRNRTLAAAAAMIVALIVGGLAIFSITQKRSRDALEEVNEVLSASEEELRVSLSSESRARVAAEEARTQARRAEYVSNLRAAGAMGGDASYRSLEKCDPELRGIEWSLLKLANDTSDEALSVSGWIQALSLAHDDKTLAIGGNVRSFQGALLELWDLESGARIVELSGHGAPVTGVAFSPDGSRLVSVDARGVLLVHDTTNGEPVLRVEHSDRSYTSLAASPQWPWALTGEEFGQLRSWNLETGEEVHLLFSEDGWSVDRIAFVGSDGWRAVSKSRVGTTLQVWDLQAGERVRVIEVGADVDSFAVHPDGKRLAVLTSPGEDRPGAVRVLDLEDDRELWLSETSTAYTDLVFADDGALLYHGTEGGILVRNATNGRERGLLRAATPTLVIASRARGVLASTQSLVRRWTTGHAGRPFPSTLDTEGEIATCLARSADGTRLFVGCEDSTMREYDPRTGALTRSWPTWLRGEYDGKVSALDVHPAEDVVVLATSAGLHVRSASDGKLLRYAAGGGRIDDLAYTSSGAWIVYTGERGTFRRRSDLEEPTRLREPQEAPGKPLLAAAGGAQDVVAVAAGEGVVAYDVATSSELWIAELGIGHAVHGLCFSQDGNRVAAAAAPKIFVLDVATGETVQAFDSSATRVRFDPAGTSIMGWGASFALHDARTGDPHAEVELAELDPVADFVVDPSSSWIASIGADKACIFPLTPATAASHWSRADARREIEDAVARIAGEHLLLGAVLDVIEQSAEIPVEWKGPAKALAKDFAFADAGALNDAAWGVVKRPGANPAAVTEAVRRMRIAVASAPKNPTFLNTLGASLYRVGSLIEAVSTLRKADEINMARSADRRHERGYDLVLIACTLAKLGKHAEAQAAFASAGEIPASAESDLGLLVAEARALLGLED